MKKQKNFECVPCCFNFSKSEKFEDMSVICMFSVVEGRIGEERRGIYLKF